MSFLAPQAYTKETLAQAFDWLQHQPKHIKQAATSPDTLVSVYMRAKMHGLSALEKEASASSKQFINDLETLKRDMAPFEETTTKSESIDFYSETPADQENTPAKANNTEPQAKASPTPQSTQAQISGPLDAESKQSIVDIQKRFNLSRPEEALRMLISIGAKHISSWE